MLWVKDAESESKELQNIIFFFGGGGGLEVCGETLNPKSQELSPCSSR